MRLWCTVFISISACFLSFSIPGTRTTPQPSQTMQDAGASHFLSMLGTTSQCASVWLFAKHGPPASTSGIKWILLEIPNIRPHSGPPESESALSKDPPGILSSLKHEKHCMWGPCRHWVMFLWTWPVHGLMSFSGLQTSSKPTHCFSRVFVLLVLVYISLGDIRKHTVLKNPMPREEHLWVTQGLLFHC